jgi:hypothetical protein
MMQTVQRPETYDAIISEIVRGGTVNFETRFPISDPLASQIVSTLARGMESDFLDRIFVDALNTALAVRIVRHFVDPSKITLALSNGLSRERLQRVCDYIEAHLDDRLTLADLARVGGWRVSALTTSAVRSSKRSGSDRSVMSCSGGSSGQKP